LAISRGEGRKKEGKNSPMTFCSSRRGKGESECRITLGKKKKKERKLARFAAVWRVGERQSGVPILSFPDGGRRKGPATSLLSTQRGGGGIVALVLQRKSFLQASDAQGKGEKKTVAWWRMSKKKKEKTSGMRKEKGGGSRVLISNCREQAGVVKAQDRSMRGKGDAEP